MKPQRGGALSAGILRSGMKYRLSRALLNELYLRLPTERCRHLHHRYCDAFREREAAFDDGHWRVRFAHKEIRAPLRRASAWLDWELALSLVGHDIEVKRVYERALLGPSPPDVFVDIGGNYGGHSLLFLAHGIEALTIEPNAECREYFETAAAANGVRGEWHELALGSRADVAVLRYPKSRTWLGQISGGHGSNGSKPGPSEVEVEVSQRPLDDFIDRLRERRALIKIDAEGSELQILEGAREVLATCAPALVLGSWRGSPERQRIFELLAEADYRIEALDGKRSQAVLSAAAFERAAVDDFLAQPAQAPLPLAAR